MKYEALPEFKVGYAKSWVEHMLIRNESGLTKIELESELNALLLALNKKED